MGRSDTSGRREGWVYGNVWKTLGASSVEPRAREGCEWLGEVALSVQPKMRPETATPFSSYGRGEDAVVHCWVGEHPAGVENGAGESGCNVQRTEGRESLVGSYACIRKRTWHHREVRGEAAGLIAAEARAEPASPKRPSCSGQVDEAAGSSLAPRWEKQHTSAPDVPTRRAWDACCHLEAGQPPARVQVRSGSPCASSSPYPANLSSSEVRPEGDLLHVEVGG